MNNLVEYALIGMATLTLERKVIYQNSVFKKYSPHISRREMHNLKKEREMHIIREDYEMTLKLHDDKLLVYLFPLEEKRSRLTMIRHDIKSSISPVHGLIQLSDSPHQEKMIGSIDHLLQYVSENLTVEKIQSK